MGGKKISGIKIHIGTDTLGLPHGIHVPPANVSDRDGALEMFELCAQNLPNIEKVLCDGGYTGEKFANAVKVLLDAVVEALLST